MAPRQSQEFMKMVVDEAINSGNILGTGNKYGVNECTLRTWIKKSGKQEEARKFNKRSQNLAKKKADPTKKRKVSTVVSKGTPFYPDVDNGVLEFITRKQSEGGYDFTRQKLIDEARRIIKEKKIEGFKATIGWWNGFRKRNNIIKAKDLNNRAADDNEDEPLEVDPSVEEEEVDPAMEIDPQVECENEDEAEPDEAIDIDPTVEEGQSDPSGHPQVECENEDEAEPDEAIDIDPTVKEGQSDPSGHPAVPAIDPLVEEGQSDPIGHPAAEVENFHQAARASSQEIEQLLNLLTPSVEVGSPVEDCRSSDILGLLWTSSRIEQEDDYGVQNNSLADLIEKFMETTSEDPLVPPLSSSSLSWCAGPILENFIS